MGILFGNIYQKLNMCYTSNFSFRNCAKEIKTSSYKCKLQDVPNSVVYTDEL